MSTLVWGAFQDDDLDGACGGSGAIGEVRATTPFLDAVVTIATLGFWAPMRVEVRCLDAGASRASL